ncbi:hypothetical protein QTN25_001790 [Entamoeba marina]
MTLPTHLMERNQMTNECRNGNEYNEARRSLEININVERSSDLKEKHTVFTPLQIKEVLKEEIPERKCVTSMNSYKPIVTTISPARCENPDPFN